MEKRESETIEFKKSTSELKEAIISLSSMLNKSGYGTVYFGIKNDGSIYGQEIGKNTTSDISKAIKIYLKPRITPKIEIIDKNLKKIIKVYAEGEDTPYSAYDRYYIRSDDEDIQMTNSQLENFFLNKTYDYSKWEKQVTDYGVDDIDEDLLIKYVNKGLESGRIYFLYRDAKTTLKKLELLSGNKLNNAGFYLFSNKKPLLLKLATYPTDERIRFTDLKQFHGNIFECIDEAVKYVANNIHWSANIIRMERVETPEIPFEAFREIIINSFVHMRVNPTSSNEIYITPTKIHIYNPGSLVPGTNPMMFANGEQGSMIRNPLIATVLYYNKTIDAFGTGFERVFKLCKNIKYEYRNNQFGFTFEFSRQNNNFSNNNLKENESLNNSLTKDELKIIELIKSKKCNKDEMAIYISKSKATVNRIIKSLTEKGLIKRIGSNKTGYWKCI